MAVWQIESGACTGRGFSSLDVDGICSKFYDFITKIPAAGGPGWTILIDKSGTPTTQNFAAGDVNVAGNEITLAGHGYLTGETIIFSTDAVMPGNLTAGVTYYVIKTGANTFKVANSLANAYASSPIDILNQGTGPHHVIIDGPYIIVSDIAAPSINEVCFIMKVGYKTLEAGYVRVSFFLGFDDANDIPIGLWGGYKLDTVDAGAFAYDFRGGAQGMIFQSRIGTSWKTAGIDTWTGSANFVEGTGVSTDTTAIASAGSSVNIEVTDSSSFSVNKYYYIWDMSSVPIVNYVKCTATPDGTHITVDVLTNTFPAGSIIASYSHRHILFSNGIGASENELCNRKGRLPYVSISNSGAFSSFPIQGTPIYNGACSISTESIAINRNSPNDEGFFAVQRGFITELYANLTYNGSDSTDMDRSYGITNNIYFTYNNTMAAGLDGRTIGGSNYLFFLNDTSLFESTSGLACLFLDTESLV